LRNSQSAQIISEAQNGDSQTQNQARSQAWCAARATQARAQQTIQTLFKAAAQILDKDGEAGLSTNKVAAAAGFSIGTLYQYFPSKEVLLRAMAAKGQDMVLQALEQYLAALELRPDVAQMDPQDLLRQAIRILLQGFATGKGFTQSLIRLGWSLEQPQETASVVRQVSDRLAIFLNASSTPTCRPPHLPSCLCSAAR